MLHAWKCFIQTTICDVSMPQWIILIWSSSYQYGSLWRGTQMRGKNPIPWYLRQGTSRVLLRQHAEGSNATQWSSLMRGWSALHWERFLNDATAARSRHHPQHIWNSRASAVVIVEGTRITITTYTSQETLTSTHATVISWISVTHTTQYTDYTIDWITIKQQVELSQISTFCNIL